MGSSYIRPREIIKFRPTDIELSKKLQNELNISKTLADILVGRGLKEFDECRSFFNPTLSELNDPFLFNQMDKVVNRIVSAISHSEPICIHGDYDVDGITGTSVVVRILRKLGAKCNYYLPNRLVDGYGISKDAIEKIANDGNKLIISVDCGITAVEEAQFASEIGIDLIITDHHEPQEVLPDAYAIIDQKVQGENYPDKNLAGVAVGFKVAQAVCLRMNAPDSFWLDELDLVSIGTAADIVPLIGENRIIAKFGYEKLQFSNNLGIKALLKEQGIEGNKISTADVVFKLAPSINAAGRLGEPTRGVKLFLSDDVAECSIFARELVAVNLERRAFDEKVQKEALLWASENIDFENEYVVVAGDENWHAGVIGISASKMVEHFCRPAFLFSIDKETGEAKGSGRGIEGVDLVSALTECSDILNKFGGHKMAAGASLDAKNLPEFRKRFNEAIKKQVKFEQLVPIIKVDSEVTVPQLTPKFFNIIKRMEPFGPGNMRPLFYSKNLNLNYPPKRVGKSGEHLKLSIISEGVVIDGIGFGFGNRINEIRESKSLSIAFTLTENTYMGKTSLQMMIKGIWCDNEI